MEDSQTQSSFSEDLQRYLIIFLKWTWLIILATAMSGATAYLVSKSLAPVYQASTTVLIDQSSDTKANEYTAILTSERLSQTYSNLILSRPILENVIQQVNLDSKAEDLVKNLKVQAVRDTQLIKLDVEDTDPQRAAQIANTIVNEFIDYINNMQTARYIASKQNLEIQMQDLDQKIKEINQALSGLADTPANQPERDRLDGNLMQYRQTYANLLQSYESIRVIESQSTTEVIQVETALPPEKPIRPRTMINTILAAVVGCMLAIGVILLIEALDDTLKSPDEVIQKLKLPLLGLITRIGKVENDDLITCAQPRSPVSEAFRAMRTNIQYASVDRSISTLLVTSPTPEDGKSTIASNLAVIMAQNGIKTVILDADLRKPMVHTLLKLPNKRGVSDLFVDAQINLDGNLRETQIPGLSAITSGKKPPNPAELLGSGKMIEIINKIKEQAEVIILDSPPLLAVTDAAVLATRVDGVLLVVKPGNTKLAAIKQAVEQLQQVGANILGVILNDVDIKRWRYGYAKYYKNYYYSYYHYYDDEDGGKIKSGNKTKKLFTLRGPRKTRN